jgi:hypothetical protein
MAGSTLISEIEFTRDHTSFWRTISPLSEDFVRQINITVLDRYQTPLSESDFSARRALINEVGFEIFARARTNNRDPDVIISNELDEIMLQTSDYISRLRAAAPYFEQKMSFDEIEETKTIARRLLQFFQDFKDVIIRPVFTGCGRLDKCYGDVLADNILYEVKAGIRPFRSIDLRQLVLYLTLNFVSKQYKIENLALYNPRQGLYFSASINDFSVHFSGLSTEELCHKVSYELTSIDTNRFAVLS